MSSENPTIWPVCWQVQKELLWCVTWAASVTKINDFITASWTNQSESLMAVRKTRLHYPSNPSVTMSSRHCAALAGQDAFHHIRRYLLRCSKAISNLSSRDALSAALSSRGTLQRPLSLHMLSPAPDTLHRHPRQHCRVILPMLIRSWATVLSMSVASWTALTAIRLCAQIQIVLGASHLLSFVQQRSMFLQVLEECNTFC